MVSIPGVRKTSFFQRKWMVELLILVSGSIGAMVTVWKLILDPKTVQLAWWAGGSSLLLLLGSLLRVYQARTEDAEKERVHDHEGLHGAVHVMHAVVAAEIGIAAGGEDTLRITVHRVVPGQGATAESPDEIEQLLPYVGGTGGGAGRRFPIRAGVSGRAARSGKVIRMHLESDSQEAMRNNMVEWGFTVADAKSLTQGRMSYMAIPIHSSANDLRAENVIAIIYLDSNRKNAFTDDVSQLALKAAIGFFEYFNVRY